jgi:acyl transferase domain-containing protein/NADPH:quinone reductase-like Zn-dependent oxidoreductase/NAD(P)-dependent dehydrogenase (short-subunit alcohol dehydrogenase family)/ubiquinone/menaquinone biosynthesis C-methylase UbiE
MCGSSSADCPKIPIKPIEWPAIGLRRISINSFGFGGTNAHLVIDDAFHYLRNQRLLGTTCTSPAPLDAEFSSLNSIPSHEFDDDRSGCQLLVASAADEKTLHRTRDSILDYYRERVVGGTVALDDLVYTLAARRSSLAWRCYAIVGAATNGSEEQLTMSKPHRSSHQTGIAFVFTGQGAEYTKMGLELLNFPIFRTTLERVDGIFTQLGCKWSVLDKLKSWESISQAEHSQPICTALQIALVKLLASLEIYPVAVIGHSSGEIAAAYCAGMISMESACRIAYYRGLLAGKLMRSTEVKGAMMSVNLSVDAVPAYLKEKFVTPPYLAVACINSHKNVTVSGDEVTIDILKEALDNDAIFAMKLSTGIAYHSPAMSAIAADYGALIGVLEPCYEVKPSIEMISTVTGGSVTAETLASAEYWVKNLLSPVLFDTALNTLIALKIKGLDFQASSNGIRDLVEVGPQAALRRPCRDVLEQHPRGSEMRYNSVLWRNRPAMNSILDLAGTLSTYGYSISVMAASRMDTKPPGSLRCLVDLPRYPFNHAENYWHESRISRDFRLRVDVPKTVLGARCADWNPLQPRWRKIISTADMPWVKDHVVSGSCIFPGAGMVIMALEAARQNAFDISARSIVGFMIKDALFSNPVVLRDERDGDEGKVEVICQLQPLRKSYEKTASWSKITITTCHGETWTECFQCTVQVQYDESHVEVDGGKEIVLAGIAARKEYASAASRCATPLLSTSFYKYCAERGIEYGPTFRILESIRWSRDGTATSIIDVSKQLGEYDGVVHPAIIDAAFQVCWLAPSQGLMEHMPTEVPHRLQDMYLSASGWKTTQTSHARVCSVASFKEAGRGIEGSITVLADDGSLLCKVGRLELSPVADDAMYEGHDRKLLHGIEWEPCLSLLTSSQLKQVCTAPDLTERAQVTTDCSNELVDVLASVISEVLTELSDSDLCNAQNHIQRYVAWLDGLKPYVTARNHNSEFSTEQRLSMLESNRPEWGVHTAVARNLLPILRCELDPLEVVFSTNLAERFYANIFMQNCDSRFCKFLELIAFEKPGLRILEVGAGTGSMTSHVLSALQAQEEKKGGTRFAQYTYTDISHAFFEDAREKFKDYRDRIQFRILDLEKDVVAQGFSEGSYDLVIAGAVLHTTKSLQATLENVRKCVKSGAKLLFFENTKPDVALQFSFGTLSGWWRGTEKWRLGPQHQYTTKSQWHDLLLQSGFSGNDLVLDGAGDESSETFSIIVSTAVASETTLPKKGRIMLCLDKQSVQQTEFATDIVSSRLGKDNYELVMFSLDETSITEIGPEDCVIVVYDLEKSLLHSLSAEALENLQALMRKCRKLLWLTKTEAEDVFVGMTTGFLRAMRSEATNNQIVRLALEKSEKERMSIVDHVVDVFGRSFEQSHLETEYVVANGLILVGRLVEDDRTNRHVMAAVYPKLSLGQWSDAPALMFDVGTRGTLDTLRFIPDPLFPQDLGPYEVEVDARAWGLNFRDVFLALGRMDESDFGLDTAGYVRRVGMDCSAFKTGDRVVMARCGSMRKYPRADEKVIVKIPEWLSFEDAASLPAPAMTAYRSLVDVAQLKKSERVLIHSAAGATGQLAVQIAQIIGAEVFATVSSNEKKELLQSTYGIPEDHIFYSRNTTFAQGILRTTGGNGVDVILNSLAGDGLRASWDCIAPFGRFVELGKADIKARSSLPMANFEKNVTFSAVDLRQILLVGSPIAQRLLDKAMQLLEGGSITCPHPRHVYSVSAIEGAFRYLQSGKNYGRIVINISPDNVVPMLLTAPMTCVLDSDASYMVAGGLGGIGRAVSRWMAKKGAKHLILPSRSGPCAPAAIDLVRELEENGVNVIAPVCDVASADALAELLRKCHGAVPPIKGCINAAMVLQDAIFEHMTHDQWRIAVQAKVHTSWNLHHQLPAQLDFFILLSSLAGVFGNVSQANYAAGNTFQDALADFRTTRGERAVSVNLGWMRTIGIVSEREEYQSFRMKGADMAKIEEKELLSLLDIYCNPSHPHSAHVKSRVLVGTVTPADLLSRGLKVPTPMTQPLFSPFATNTDTGVALGSGDLADLAGLFKQTRDAAERATMVADALAQKLARSLSVSSEDIDQSRPLFEYGVDSLVAVELRNWIGREFAADVPVFNIMGGASISEIGTLTVEKSSLGGD